MSEPQRITREEQILMAKELYNQGSRNYLVKCYGDAADDLSQVCALFEEIYGEFADELGMPYLLYAKSLIALALDENKVIDVPDKEDDNDDDDDDYDGANDEEETKQIKTNKSEEAAQSTSESEVKNGAETAETKEADSTDDNKKKEETPVSSTDEINENGSTSKNNPSEAISTDNEKPSTSTGTGEAEAEAEEEEDNEASSLQLAWEILELAAKIFTAQGISGLPNLAEVYTELANIEFENNILDSAREDYEKACKIYEQLPDKYRRAMAEIYYKIGLTYLMQQLNQEGAESLKKACSFIEDEIAEVNSKENLTDKDTENVKDMEETKQEIWAKIVEIEETGQQNLAEVRNALDSFIGPAKDKSAGEANTSEAAGSSVVTSSSKPTDISHLVKRKRPCGTGTSEAEPTESPAKKPAV